MNKLKAELGLVQTNLANGSVSLAEEYATQAIGILNTKDPVNNITWKDEIAERNARISGELVSAVSAIDDMNMSVLLSNGDTNQSISDIDAIIDEAITSRIDKEQRDNATIQATALGDIINALLNYYGDAFSVGFDMGNMSQWHLEWKVLHLTRVIH